MSVKRLERAASKDQATSSKGISTKEGPPTSPVWRPSSKIRDRHWERLAIVYIRQSSPHQVLENRESRERQYALGKVAEQFGWPADRVLVIDEDQGLSGKFSENRDGPTFCSCHSPRLMARLRSISKPLQNGNRWENDSII